MPTEDTPTSRTLPARRGWRPTRRAWFVVLGAFALGLLLFAMLLLRDRRHGDFYRPDAAAPAEAGGDVAPLPAPDVGTGGAIGLPAPGADRPEAPVAAAGTDLGRAPASAVPAPRVERQATATQPFVPPRPIPGRTPAPHYPPQALRRGEEGTVNVRVEIGPDGVPTSVSLVSGSGSRLLDRAALDAVRQWRFVPAQLDGHPTVGNVVVPVDFRRN